jgi:hypothetical protein
VIRSQRPQLRSKSPLFIIENRLLEQKRLSQAESDFEQKPDHIDSPSLRVRLPGFIREDEIGLGDVIKRVTYAIGIRPCSGCERRASALNRWVSFTK